jgi:hypothetical protein
MVVVTLSAVRCWNAKRTTPMGFGRLGYAEMERIISRAWGEGLRWITTRFV